MTKQLLNCSYRISQQIHFFIAVEFIGCISQEHRSLQIREEDAGKNNRVLESVALLLVIQCTCLQEVDDSFKT